jgi:adenosyl cobinamide kinase/adenosyl cobinamide phosphate guanylyltransferase
MKSKELKSEAKKLFLRGTEVTDICKRLRLPKNTVYNWTKKEKWSDLRKSKIQSVSSAAEVLLDKLEKMIASLDVKQDADKMAKTADSIVKIIKSIKTLSKDADRFSAVIFVIGELGKYMNDSKSSYDEFFREKFDTLLEGFQKLMIQKFSDKTL